MYFASVNMKKLFLIITLFGSFFGYAQQQDITKHLTKSVWKLKSDEMKGIGSHAYGCDLQLQLCDKAATYTLI
jgi:hypothetical protein